MKTFLLLTTMAMLDPSAMGFAVMPALRPPVSTPLFAMDTGNAAVGADKFTPDVVFPDDGQAISFWTVVSGNDEVGLVIDNLKKGDVVSIHSLSGIASFTESNNKLFAGFVAIASGILQDGASVYTKDQAKATNKAIAEQTDILVKELSKDVKHKRRDGYGQDPGTDDFAKHEGGVIMCMPSAHGAVYATSNNYLEAGAKYNGRLTEYFSENIKRLNCWFPCRREGGVMSQTCETNGPLHVLAFDQKFTDNSGSYTMKVQVTRPTATLSNEELLQMLKDQELEYGI